jgi:hypothetical protein
MAKSKRVYDSEIVPDPVLKLWVCTDHDKLQNEAKVASVIVAYDKERAVELLNEALEKCGLRGHNMWRYRLEEMPLDRAYAEILNDGDY